MLDRRKRLQVDATWVVAASAAVTAVATVVLAVITAKYAEQTILLTEEAKSAREHGVLPILVGAVAPEFRHSPTGLWPHQFIRMGDTNSLYVRNIGRGPALNVVAKTSVRNAGRCMLDFSPRVDQVGSLADGDEYRLELRHIGDTHYGDREPTIIEVLVTCQSIYKRELASKISMVMATRMINELPGWTWIISTETQEIH